LLLQRVDFSHHAKIQKALLLALYIFLGDVALDFSLFHPCLTGCKLEEILILPEFTFAEVVICDKLFLHIDVTHDIRTVIFVLVNLGLKTVNFLFLLCL
jgi:hypothetical protein